MLKGMILLATILLAFTASAQDGGTVGFACGYGGTSTKLVKKAEKNIKRENIRAIEGDLFSSNTGRQFLATIILEGMSNNGSLELNRKQLDRIEQIKSSSRLLDICSGCTTFGEFKLISIFNDSEYPYFVQHARNWYSRLQEINK